MLLNILRNVWRWQKNCIMIEKSTISIQCVSRLPHIPSERQFKKWIDAALIHVSASVKKPKVQSAELTLRIVNAAEGRNLNSAFRGKDYPTNVLTFVYHEKKSPMLIGDVVLCAPIVAREAREQGKMLAAHYAHMVVHGVLHLSGFDHESDREATIMEAQEVIVLAALGFTNPYADDLG